MTKRKLLFKGMQHHNFFILPISGKQGLTARIRRADGGAFQYEGSTYGAISTKSHDDLATVIKTAKDIIDKFDLK